MRRFLRTFACEPVRQTVVVVTAVAGDPDYADEQDRLDALLTAVKNCAGSTCSNPTSN